MELNKLKLSVVMSTYCGERYLSTQLDSILNQSIQCSEIIIVDDFSCDYTWNVLCEYAIKYSQIKIYRNDTNIGVIKSFEKALMLCSGDYIALADQDDYWLPNKLEILINKIGDNWLIHSDAYVVDEKLRIINESFSSIKPYHDNTLEMYYLRNNVTGCTVLLHRDLLKLALPFPEHVIMHDHYLALCAKFFNKLSYLNQPLIKYRQHLDNMIGSKNMKSYDLMISTFIKNINFLDDLKQAQGIKFDIEQIEISKNYFESIICCKFPAIRTIRLVYRKFGFFTVCSMIIYSSTNKKIAKACFEFIHK